MCIRMYNNVYRVIAMVASVVSSMHYFSYLFFGGKRILQLKLLTNEYWEGSSEYGAMENN